MTDDSVVYLYLVNYGKARPEEVTSAISGFLAVSLLSKFASSADKQDCEDRNPLIRGLAIRTMSSIPLPQISQSLIDPLRHALQDADPYVRKTAAIS